MCRPSYHVLVHYINKYILVIFVYKLPARFLPTSRGREACWIYEKHMIQSKPTEIKFSRKLGTSSYGKSLKTVYQCLLLFTKTFYSTFQTLSMRSLYKKYCKQNEQNWICVFCLFGLKLCIMYIVTNCAIRYKSNTIHWDKHDIHWRYMSENLVFE